MTYEGHVDRLFSFLLAVVFTGISLLGLFLEERKKSKNKEKERGVEK